MVALEQLIPVLFIFVLSLVILVKSSDALIESASRLAISLGIHEFAIGIIIIGFGTSLPELVSSGFASFYGFSGIAVGNVIGSVVANILLVLGIVSLFGAIYSTWEGKRRDVYLMLILSFALFAMSLDGVISRTDGFIFIASIFASIYVMLQGEAGQYKLNHKGKVKRGDIIVVAISLFAIVFGAKYFVSSAEDLALLFGISEYVVGLSVVAVGTSLPELFTSLAAIKKRYYAMTLGNIVGSSLFAIALVLGTASLIAPVTIPAMVTWVHIPIMILCSVVLAALIKFGQVPKYAGYVFIPGYALFLYLSYALV